MDGLGAAILDWLHYLHSLPTSRIDKEAVADGVTTDGDTYSHGSKDLDRPSIEASVSELSGHVSFQRGRLKGNKRAVQSKTDPLTPYRYTSDPTGIRGFV